MINNLKKLNPKACYGHLGGILGNRLFERLIELKWFEKGEDDREYTITPKGENEFKKIGVDIYERN